MAKLTVKLHGENVCQVQLEDGMEYIAGRSTDAQIPLPSERGISRHHLKFYQRDGVWIAEALSQFVPIQKGGESLQVFELTTTCMFSVMPFEFHFELSQESPTETPKNVNDDNLPTVFQPRPSNSLAVINEGDTHPKVNHEATIAGNSSLMPYFRISFPNTADDQVLKLEGRLWVGGRDPSCEIFVDSPHISRKHFELARTEEGFYITDLGSSNGTKLNGRKIPPHEPTKIESGDSLEVMNVQMAFEIRDSRFTSKLESLPVPVFDPMLAMPPAPWYPSGPLEPAADQPEESNRLKREWMKLKKNPVRMGLVGVIVLILVVALAGGKKTPNRAPASDKNQSVSFEKLTPEQKAIVKDSFHLARNLYVQGKYALCLTELAKLTELIPQYENSRELQSFCEQGRELLRKEHDAEMQERERAQVNEKIKSYVEMCTAKLKGQGTVDETRACLADAIELDPQNQMISQMLQNAQLHEQQVQFQAAQKKKRAEEAKKGHAQFHEAQSLYKSGHLAKALHVFKIYVKTPYPENEYEKSVAKREIASVGKKLNVEVVQLLTQCKSLGAKSDFKGAYLACDKAVEDDPNNKVAANLRTKMKNKLRQAMESIYQDSVLEESLGNVDGAEDKWKQIIKQDLPDGDFAQKAKVKLQKYGISL